MNQDTNSKTMEYKGYTAIVEWDEESKCYSGEVQDTWGMVVFHDYTWELAYQGFKNILDWYLENCEEDGEEPRMSNRKALAYTS